MAEPGMQSSPARRQSNTASYGSGATIGGKAEGNSTAGIQLANNQTTAEGLINSKTSGEQLSRSLTTADLLANSPSGNTQQLSNNLSVASSTSPSTSAGVEEPVNGYFSELAESWAGDWQEVKLDWNKTSGLAEEQSEGSTLLQQTGNVVDFGVDLISSVFVNDKTVAWAKDKIDSVSKTEAYQTAKQAVAEVAGVTVEVADKFLDENPQVKQVLLESAQVGMEKAQDVIDYIKQTAAEHPEAVRNLGAVGEIIQVIPVGKAGSLATKGGRSAIDSATELGKRIEIDADPTTLGANGGNLSIRLRKPHVVLTEDPFPTRTQSSGVHGDKPRGVSETIEKGANSEGKRGIRAEDKSAQRLALAGYRVEQQPTVTGTLTPELQDKLGLKQGKNPDYLIEGRVFDNYAPRDKTSIRGIHSTISEKVGLNQAHRIVVNLSDSNATRKEVVDALKADPIANLKEVIVIEKGGNISHFVPNPNHRPN